ncbi:MAG: ribbon-helix-helix domain-containing protein [Ilumatobacteraceae bacterium]
MNAFVHRRPVGPASVNKRRSREGIACLTAWYADRMTTQIAVRLPDELVEKLDSLVGAPHESRSEAIRRAIELYVYRMACERDAQRYEELPLTDAELVFADDPDAWAGTPAW